MSDKTDIEQDVQGCWGVVDDLKAISWRLKDGSVMDQEEVVKLVEGLAELYQIKFEKLWETTGQIFNE